MLAGCADKDAASTETDPSTGSGTDSEATSDASGEDPTAGETGDDPVATGTETADDPIATDTDPAETSATEPGTGGDTEDTGFVPPEACGSPDPSVKATFSLELDGWPIDPLAFDLVAPCQIDAVATMDGTVSTGLTCEFEGQSHTATLEILAPPEGEVTWAAGQEVTLVAQLWSDVLNMADARSVELRASDESLLVSATDSLIDEAFKQRFAPLSVQIVRVCSEDQRFGEEPAQLEFTPVGGAVVGILSGQRGVVPIDADQRFVIDVEKATTTPEHVESQMQVLLRRVQGGG